MAGSHTSSRTTSEPVGSHELSVSPLFCGKSKESSYEPGGSDVVREGLRAPAIFSNSCVYNVKGAQETASTAMIVAGWSGGMKPQLHWLQCKGQPLTVKPQSAKELESSEVRKVSERKLPEFFEFRPEFCPEFCSEKSPDCFEDFSWFFSWGAETRKYNQNPHHFRCKICRQTRKKNPQEFSGERAI